MKGRLIGLGVGSGNKEDLSLRAKKYLEESDVLVFPHKSKDKCIAYKIAEDFSNNKDMRFCDFPMTKDKEVLHNAHIQCASLIMSLLNQGKTVSFITIGDPTLYSTYFYVHHIVENEGYETLIVNGVPSICAVAGRLGISLGEEDEEIHIIPGSYSLDKAFGYGGTLVFMKSGKNLALLKERLLNLKEDYKAEAVSNCFLPDERIYRDISEMDTSSYLTIVIVKKGPSYNSKFFQNTDCPYFPCHGKTEEDRSDFNCLFCFCPLYFLGDKCGGSFKYTKGIKSCVDCNYPHERANYDLIIKRLKELK